MVMSHHLNLRQIAALALLVLWASFSFSLALAEISFAISAIAYLFWKARSRPFQFHLPRSIWLPLLVLFTVGMLSILVSEIPLKSLRGVFKLANQMMIFLMVSDIFRDQKDRRKLEYVFVFFYLLLILDALYQCGVGKDFIRGFKLQPASSGARITASFKSYGLLAAYLLLTLPYLFSLAQHYLTKGRRSVGFLSLTLFSFGLVVLFFTRSRGAYFAAILGLFAILLITRKWRGMGIIGLLLGLALVVVPKNVIIHLDQFGREQSLVERYYLWDRAIKVIQAKPILGTGINTYAAVHQKYDKTYNWRVQGYYAHNGYLQMAAETGIVGLGAFLYFIFQSIRLNLSSRNSDSAFRLGLFIGIINFLCFALVDTILHNSQSVTPFWFILGLHCAASLPREKSLAS